MLRMVRWFRLSWYHFDRKAVCILEISLAGKVAVVTGAASGIGLAITRAYLECGAAGVVAVDRRKDLPPGLEEAKSRYGDRLNFVAGDVAQEATAMAFTETAVGRFGR